MSVNRFDWVSIDDSKSASLNIISQAAAINQLYECYFVLKDP
jgi:hypothetical protein